MLTVSEIVVKHVIAGIKSDSLLKFFDSLFMQTLRLVVDCQPRMQLLQWILVVDFLLAKLLADYLVMLYGFFAIA